MGKKKAKEEQHLPPGVTSSDQPQNAETECRCSYSWIRKLFGFRCILIFLFSLALFLSALFWLPPFLDHNNLHDDSKYKGHDIVASFIVNKPVTVLEYNKLQLEAEILEEIDSPSNVTILSLDPLPRPNNTKVVFVVAPEDGNSGTLLPAISLIKSSFAALVVRQSVLRLTSSLFGNPYFFEVLKFKGGMIITPEQKGFPLQTVQTKFNFSLNFPIYQILSNFNELASQLKSGLRLTSYENLFVVLSNSEGSTVDAPTTIQSYVLLAVGIPSSKQRIKQLAQTIMGPHNLGLNNTDFGKVKHVRLSSILQHSLNGSDSAISPSPASVPHSSHQHQHHHHHHHHHNTHLTPATSPIPAPAPKPGEGSSHHHHHRHHHHHHHHHHNTHLTPATSPIPAPAPKPGEGSSHHHHHHHNTHLTPTTSPIPAPAPKPGEGATPPEVGSPATTKSAPTPHKSSHAQPPEPGEGATPPEVGSPAITKSAPTPHKSSQAQPPDCPFERRKRSRRSAGRHTYLTPAVAPSIEHHHHPVPISSPKLQVEPPTHASHSAPASSPLPDVDFAHAEPPPKREPAAEQPLTQPHGLSISSSSAGCLRTVKVTSLIFLVLVLHV